MEPFDKHPDVLAARAAGTLAMVAVGVDAPWPGPDVLEACGPLHPPPVQLADGRWVGTRFTLDPPCRAVVVHGGPAPVVIPFDTGWEPVSNVRVAPSGTRCVVAMRVHGRGHVVEHRLDGTGDWTVLRTGYDPATPSHLYGQRENVWSADYAGSDDAVVVIVTRGAATLLLLLHRTETGWHPVAETAAKGFDPVCRGACAVIYDSKGSTVWGVVGDGAASKLVRLGKVEPLFCRVHPADTRTHLWGHRGVGRDGHILVGEDLALARKQPKRR